MKKIFRGAVCALLLMITVVLSSCAKKSPSTVSFQAMDTLMSFTVYGGDGDIGDTLKQKVNALDKELDATDENSEIFRLNTAKSATLSDDAAELMTTSLGLCERLGGSFDVTVFPAVQAWGFVSGNYRVPTDTELASLAKDIDYRSVKADGSSFTLPENVRIDLGAVAKGYAADKCLDILRDKHADGAVLNLGGTICLYGKKPDGSRFKVGIADPENPAGYFGYLSCDEGVVATSGGYERYFEQDGTRYIHILDPSTAAPVSNGVRSVTIVCDNGAEADALSTALFVMGLDKATAYYREHGGFDFILLTDGGDLYLSEGVYDSFTLDNNFPFTLHKVSRQ